MNAIKNLTGLAECFGKSQTLQKDCNLIILTCNLNPDPATHPEEAMEIAKLHRIIDQYHLQGKIRWMGMRLPIIDLGEAYRVIADHQGIYINFARFAAFGHSILEAMISGLPTFTTEFGGASEIIQGWEYAFRLNPTDMDGAARKITIFLNKCQLIPDYRQKISQSMIERIRHRYNWYTYTNKLLLLTKLFSFWNFIYPEKTADRDRYLETLFHLIYKPRAEKILANHMLL
jgi:sucrose synthase